MLFLLLVLLAQKPVDGFIPHTFKTRPYRLFVPAAYDRAQKYPLVIWLHGAGSVGTDNFKQISSASFRGTHTWTAAPVQAQHPAFVLAPQSHSGSWGMDF